MNTSTTTVVPSVSMTSTACIAGTSSPSINSEFHALSNLVFCSGKTFITFYFLELGCYNKLNWSFPREEIKTLIGNHFIFIIIGRVNSNIPAIAGGVSAAGALLLTIAIVVSIVLVITLSKKRVKPKGI